jgi:hypothetical protein
MGLVEIVLENKLFCRKKENVVCFGAVGIIELLIGFETVQQKGNKFIIRLDWNGRCY